MQLVKSAACSRFVLFLLSLLCIFLQNLYAESNTIYPGNAPGFSSPVIAEIDGDSANGNETAIASSDGKVHVLNSDGTLRWSNSIPGSVCSLTSKNDRLYSSVAVGDLFGNGVPYLVVGFGGFRGKPCDGGVAAFKGGDGTVAWVFNLRQFAKKERLFAFRHAIFGTPALGDVDGDGDLEIGFGGFDRNIFLLNPNGTLRWYTLAADTVFSSPSFVDIDGDKKLEMIIGTDISQNTRINPPTPNGGYLYALKAGEASLKQYGFRDFRLSAWRTEFDQVMQSSPAIGELIASNPGPEIVVGSGCFFPQTSATRRGKWFKVISAKTGAVLRTLNVTACTQSSPAIADLDGDGRNDVIATTSGDRDQGGDGSSHVIAWNPESNQTLWDVVPKLGTRTDVNGGDFGKSPVIGDLDGNGSLEVVVPVMSGLAVLEGVSGRHLSCDSNACDSVTFRTNGAVTSTAAIGDLNADGTLDLVAATPSGKQGAVTIWSEELSDLGSAAGPYSAYYAPWPFFKGNAERSGKGY